MMRGDRSPTMSTSTSAFSPAALRALRACRRSTGCRRCDRCRPSPRSVASSPSKKISSIVNALRARLQHARQFEQKRRARPAVVRADEPELPKQLRVVVPRDRDPILARAWDGRDEIHHRDLRRCGVCRSKACCVDGDADRLELLDDVLARRSMAGDPAGRGPMPPSGAGVCTPGMNRSRSGFGLWAVGLRRRTRGRQGGNRGGRCTREPGALNRATACPAAGSPAASARRRSAAAARSSARDRAASLPTARTIPPCAESRRAPGKSPRKAHRLIDQPRIEIDVGIELARDEVLVLQRDPLELERDVEQRIPARHLEHFVRDPLDDLRARVVRLVDAVAEAHQPAVARPSRAR